MFVGATIGRPFWFCGCLRAINDRPYEEPKHPYENQPNRVGFFLYVYIHRIPEGKGIDANADGLLFKEQGHGLFVIIKLIFISAG